MNILALETSGLSGSIAALASAPAARVLAERVLDPERRSARTLAPALAELLRELGWRPNDVQLVAVAIGPGSFTGLRVGVTTAKTFAFATGAAVFGIGTLAAIARQALPFASGQPIIEAVLNAQRGELFAATYTRASADDFTEVRPPRIVTEAAWLAELPAAALVTGSGLNPGLRAQLPPSIAVAPEACWLPLASTIGQLAAERCDSGERHDVFSLSPFYLRRPAAEEKRLGT